MSLVDMSQAGFDVGNFLPQHCMECTFFTLHRPFDLNLFYCELVKSFVSATNDPDIQNLT